MIDTYHGIWIKSYREYFIQPFGSAIYRKTKCFDNIVKENPAKIMYIVWWKGWRGFFFTELL